MDFQIQGLRTVTFASPMFVYERRYWIMILGGPRASSELSEAEGFRDV